MMTNGRAGIGSTRSVGGGADKRDDLSGTRSADFIRASGMNAPHFKGRTHACTRPTRQSIKKHLARRRPSTHATEVSSSSD